MQLDIDKEVALLQRMTVGSCERNSKRRGASQPIRATSSGSSNASLGRCKPISKATSHSGPGVAPLNSLAAPTSAQPPPSHQAVTEASGRHRDRLRSARRRQSSPAAEIRDRASLQRREDRGARSGERLRIRGGDLQDAQRCCQEDHGPALQRIPLLQAQQKRR